MKKRKPTTEARPIPVCLTPIEVEALGRMAHEAHCSRNALIRAIIGRAVSEGQVEAYLPYLPERRVRA